MNRHVFAFALVATATSLMLAGVGVNDSYAVDSKPVAAGSASPISSKISLDTAFSETLTCYAGVKPYFQKTLVGQWDVSFDGDLLTVSGSGQTNSGRFSTSGNPIDRTDSVTGSKLHTLTGASGGRIWFERNLNGKLLSAGIVHRTGADRVECGDRYAKEWLDDSTDKPFGRDGDRLVWQSATAIDLNCIRYSGTDFSAPEVQAPRAAQLQLIQNGAMSVAIVGDTNAPLTFIQADETERTATFVHETVRDGGQRIWISRRDGDGDSDAVRLRFRFNYNLLDIEYRQADGVKTRCVPAPLDPRRFVES